MRKSSDALKILYVEWLDASGTAGWKDREEIQTEPSECKSVGFLVEETKDAITLALSVSITNDNYGHCVAIPKVSIKRRKFL